MELDHFNPSRECEQRYSQKQLLFEIWRVLRRILKAITPTVSAVVVTPEDTMDTPAIGNTLGYKASVVPSNAVTTPSEVAWTSSDSTNAPVTQDSADTTGLSASVTIGSGATVGENVTITATVTNPDGTTAAGSASFVVVSPDVTAVTVEQTS